jgi:hypothetical protein
VSAILYAADLLSIGKTYNRESTDPRVGAFDKIIQIKLNQGKSFLEALESAQNSLSKNIIRLRNAQPYTEEEKAKLRPLGYGEAEFHGREVAVKIERALGERYGASAINNIASLIERAKAEPPEKLENTMGCYYRLATSNT